MVRVWTSWNAFSLGRSEIEFTRRARRCPAISIDLVTGDREPKSRILLHIGPNQFVKVNILPTADDGVSTS